MRCRKGEGYGYYLNVRLVELLLQYAYTHFQTYREI